MTTRIGNPIRLLSGFAVLLFITTAALAQQPATGTIKTLALKSAVLGEERVLLVRTRQGTKRTNKNIPCST